MNTAIISAHIFKRDDGEDGIEIFTNINDDSLSTGIFDDIKSALIDQVKPNFDVSGSYFFMAVVKSEFEKYENWECTEYEVEHEVIVIKSLDDLPKVP